MIQSGSCASAEVAMPLLMLMVGRMEGKSGGSVPVVNFGGSVPGSICRVYAAAWLAELVGGPCAPLVALCMLEELPPWIGTLSGEDAWTVARKVEGVKFLGSSGFVFYSVGT